MSPHSWHYHHWQNIRLAIPIVVGALATIGIWTADVIAMGQIDSINLAAGSLATRYYQPIYFTALGVTLAVGPLVAQGIGAGNERQIRRALRQGMLIGLIMGILAAPIVLLGEPVLNFLGQDPALTAMIGGFLLWSAISLPFIFVFFVLRQYMVAHQRPTPQVVAMIIGLAANIAGNHILVNGIGPFPKMGLTGIAVSTTVVYLLICVGLLIWVGTTSPYKETKPFQRLWVMDWGITIRILKIGFPIGMTILAESGMFIAVTMMIGLFGTAALAAGAIANQIAAVAFMVPIALAQASTIRVSNYAGAADRANTRRSSWSAMAVGTAITAITTLILLIWPEYWISFYLDPDDPLIVDVTAFAIPMVIIAGIFQIPDGLQAIATSILRGLNDTKIPALLGIASFWIAGVGSGALAGFVLGWGPVALWGGLVLGLGVAAIVLAIRVQRAMKRITEGGQILSA